MATWGFFYSLVSNLEIKKAADLKWSHQDSNLDLEFRKLLFYPLNYETTLAAAKEVFYRSAKIGN